MNFYLSQKQQIEINESMAKSFEKWAKEARDDNSRRHWMDKANECWQRALELREGA